MQPAWSARGHGNMARLATVGPWQYQCWVGGWVVHRYSTHPVPTQYPPSIPQPLVPTSPPHREQAVRRPCSSADMQFGAAQGDPRGVITQQVSLGHRTRPNARSRALSEAACGTVLAL